MSKIYYSKNENLFTLSILVKCTMMRIKIFYWKRWAVRKKWWRY